MEGSGKAFWTRWCLQLRAEERVVLAWDVGTAGGRALQAEGTAWVGDTGWENVHLWERDKKFGGTRARDEGLKLEMGGRETR